MKDKNCPNCGAVFELGSIKCPYCGTPYDDALKQKLPEQDTEKNAVATANFSMTQMAEALEELAQAGMISADEMLTTLGTLGGAFL